MKISHRDKQANAGRVQASQTAHARAAERFRQRHIDASLKRLLKVVLQPAEFDERPSP